MSKELPPIVTADSSPEAIAERMDEERKRKDLTQPGVAQDALDLLDEINARKGSSSEVFTDPAIGGYSLRGVLVPALNERDRIVRELRNMPSVEVESTILDVAATMTKYGIVEFVPKAVEPE